MQNTIFCCFFRVTFQSTRNHVPKSQSTRKNLLLLTQSSITTSIHNYTRSVHFVSTMCKRRHKKGKGDKSPHLSTVPRKEEATPSPTTFHSPCMPFNQQYQIPLRRNFVQVSILWIQVPLHQKVCYTALCWKSSSPLSWAGLGSSHY